MEWSTIQLNVKLIFMLLRLAIYLIFQCLKIGVPTSKDERLITFTNICGLLSNLKSVHDHFCSPMPCILSILFENFPCQNNRSFPNLEQGKPDILLTRLILNRLILKSSTKMICWIYRSPNYNLCQTFFDALVSSLCFFLSKLLFFVTSVFTLRIGWGIQQLTVRAA